MNDLDLIDIEILRLLQQDGRISNSELAQRVNLAPPTVLRRVKLLEERGYIKGYAALVDPLALGLTVTAFIFVETTAGCNLSETETFLAQLPGWELVEDGRALSRTFKFGNYHETLAFVNALAWIAHGEDHHPDLGVHYDRCVVRWSTHDVGGLSENDFICAAKAQALVDG